MGPGSEDRLLGRDQARDAAQLRELLLDGLARHESQLLDEAHIIVCTDVDAGTATYSGPFADGYAALSGLVDHQQEHARDGVALRCSVEPLFAC